MAPLAPPPPSPLPPPPPPPPVPTPMSMYNDTSTQQLWVQSMHTVAIELKISQLITILKGSTCTCTTRSRCRDLLIFIDVNDRQIRSSPFSPMHVYSLTI